MTSIPKPASLLPYVSTPPSVIYFHSSHSDILKNHKVLAPFLFFFVFCFLFFFKQGERERGPGEREWGNLLSRLHASVDLSTRSSISQPWDHDLSQNRVRCLNDWATKAHRDSWLLIFYFPHTLLWFLGCFSIANKSKKKKKKNSFMMNRDPNLIFSCLPLQLHFPAFLSFLVLVLVVRKSLDWVA